MSSAETDAPSVEAPDDGAYRVLARKYRPQTFDDLIGQEAMVRTLSNAFESGRVAHGFVLTGVRGVGKTTTARIIAKGLNCVGPDGQGGPTIHPCGTCDTCRSIAESRNVDVLEMDAASRTGIDDIREIIESVRYRPASCRYKVYIIDEVHMLSKAAFNGLLKTLEEPPPHVKFIFATTEIRKVPVTVLSRCQRFDLRRIEPEPMMAYLNKIATAEGAQADDEALALVARASEGSARDAVSLLDQAIAHGQKQDGGVIAISADGVRDMLGLADRSRVIDLFDMLMNGDTAGALGELRSQYDSGADPLMILNDLLEVVHWLTRVNVVPEALKDPAISPDERARGAEMAKVLPVNVLTRAWQILLKGLSETTSAPNPIAAAEMVLIRLGYAATLKTPDELLRMLESGGPSVAGGAPGQAPAAPRPSTPNGNGAVHAHAAPSQPAPPPIPPSGPTAMAASGGGPAPQPVAMQAPEPHHPPQEQIEGPATFEALVEMAHERREIRFELALRSYVHLIRYEPGHLTFRPTPDAPGDLSQQIIAYLKAWTGQRWSVVINNEEQGAPTLAEVNNAAEAKARAELMAHPLVKAALEAFPGGELGEVHVPEAETGSDDEAAVAALDAEADEDDEF